MFLEWAH
jgi:serine/threonine protein phosphatase PrpC